MSLLRQNLVNLEVYVNAETLDAISLKDAEETVALLDYHPSLTMHAPFMDLSPGAVDSKARAATMERFHQAFDVAEVLRPSAIVFHSGYEKWKYDHRVDVWLEQSLMTWPEMTERARAIGAKIAIENIFEDEPESLRQLMGALETGGLSGIGICFDTGHFNLFSKEPLGAWLESLGPYIIELHLHDNNRDKDSHLAMGDGTFDFEGLFIALGKRDIIYTIEAHNAQDALKSIERLKRYL